MGWNNVLQLALQAVLTVALPVVVKFLVDWLRAKTNELMLGLDQQARWAVNEAVEIAVRSAEQSGLAGLIEGSAEAKKRYACDFAEKYLAGFGIKLDLDVLADMIEAEVLRQFGKGDPREPMGLV
jgi:Bacteriophage holin of superfamily 6 (Holin_LLH)